LGRFTFEICYRGGLRSAASFKAHFNRRSAPTLHHGKIVPANASAFNKSRLIPTMMIVAAAKSVRREASLRGGTRAKGSSGQQGNTR
jgi:hypothetical protein